MPESNDPHVVMIDSLQCGSVTFDGLTQLMRGCFIPSLRPETLRSCTLVVLNDLMRQGIIEIVQVESQIIYFGLTLQAKK